jgi:hypothetical protein
VFFSGGGGVLDLEPPLEPEEEDEDDFVELFFVFCGIGFSPV